MKLFCFGYGYVARHLAGVLRDKGWEVSGTTRDGAEEGIHAFNGFAALSAEGKAALRAATHVLVSIPPSMQGDIPLRFHRDDVANAEWVGYLSTTGVYGDWQGEWVDEDSPLLATEPRSILRIEAEKQWLAASEQSVIFRLAGIYGAGRNALEQLREGTARRIEKEGQFFSRCHVVDIVQVLLASIEKGVAGGRVFNIADALPAASHEVVLEAAHLLGVEPPPLVSFDKAELSPMATSFYAANRRVKAKRILRDLGVELCYPTYKEGLRALLTAKAGE